MPLGGHTALTLGFTKARRSASVPATTYAAASATSSPRCLSNRDWINPSSGSRDGGARAFLVEVLYDPAGVWGRRHRVSNPLQTTAPRERERHAGSAGSACSPEVLSAGRECGTRGRRRICRPTGSEAPSHRE